MRLWAGTSSCRLAVAAAASAAAAGRPVVRPAGHAPGAACVHGPALLQDCNAQGMSPYFFLHIMHATAGAPCRSCTSHPLQCPGPAF